MHCQWRKLNLTEKWAQAFPHYTGSIHKVELCADGHTNNTFRVWAQKGMFIIKYNRHKIPNLFEQESHNINLLAEFDWPVVPIIACNQNFALLEHIEASPTQRTSAAATGRLLARLHAPGANEFGFSRPSYLGTILFSAHQTSHWPSFFINHRLGPVAQQLGINIQERPWSRLIQSLDAGLYQPSLLHGDLWQGNLLPGPYFIDPCPLWGDRLVDIAFTLLYGGFSPEFYQGYSSVFDLTTQPIRPLLRTYYAYALLTNALMYGGDWLAQAYRVASGEATLPGPF